MAIPRNKQELLSEINLHYQKLMEELEDISEDEAKKNELEGHSKNTKMSINNLIAYLIGWGNLVLKWNESFEKNKEVHFPEKEYKWTELGALAQKFYKDYEDLNLEELSKKLSKTTNKIISLIEKTDDEKLYTETWYKEYPMGRMIQLNTSSPFKNARTRIRKWKRMNRNI